MLARRFLGSCAAKSFEMLVLLDNIFLLWSSTYLHGLAQFLQSTAAKEITTNIFKALSENLVKSCFLLVMKYLSSQFFNISIS
jgi:hypothetical protein